MPTGVAVRLGGEALKGCEHTVALWPWGWGGQGCWARDGGVARPRPMEHDAQPYECDQRELVEEKMRYHGKPPHTRAEMRVFYPVCQVAELAAGYRYIYGPTRAVKEVSSEKNTLRDRCSHISGLLVKTSYGLRALMKSALPLLITTAASRALYLIRVKGSRSDLSCHQLDSTSHRAAGLLHVLLKHNSH